MICFSEATVFGALQKKFSNSAVHPCQLFSKYDSVTDDSIFRGLPVCGSWIRSCVKASARLISQSRSIGRVHAHKRRADGTDFGAGHYALSWAGHPRKFEPSDQDLPSRRCSAGAFARKGELAPTDARTMGHG